MARLSTKCPACSRRILFDELMLGKKGKCPACGGLVCLSREIDKPAVSPSDTVIDDPFAEMAEAEIQTPARNSSSGVRSKKTPEEGRSIEESAPIPEDSTSKPLRLAEAKNSKHRTQTSPEVPRPGKTSEDKNQLQVRSNRTEGTGRLHDPAADPIQENPSASEGSVTETQDVQARVPREPIGHSEESPDADVTEEPGEEPYIDELGLSELPQQYEDHWGPPAELPPVQKQFRKRKQKRPVAELANGPSTGVRSGMHNEPTPLFSPEHHGASRSLSRPLFFGLMLLALLPLGLHLLMADRREIEERLDATFAQHDGDTEESDWQKIGTAAEDGTPLTLNTLVRILPGSKLDGALLPQETWIHWGFAAASSVVFLTGFAMLFRGFPDAAGAALRGAVATAVLGVLLLLVLQWASVATQGVWVTGRGFLVLLFYLVKFTGFSFSGVLDQETNFMSGFMAFTLLTGVCEEFCKILPVLVYLGTSRQASWQGACYTGLVSGAGFGISEAVLYSSWYDNGIGGPEIYGVRFISSVALHAAWAGAGSVLLYFNQKSLHGEGESSDFLATLVLASGMSIILHGLYDTFLRREQTLAALIAGVLSVVWLMVVIEMKTRRDSAANSL